MTSFTTRAIWERNGEKKNIMIELTSTRSNKIVFLFHAITEQRMAAWRLFL